MHDNNNNNNEFYFHNDITNTDHWHKKKTFISLIGYFFGEESTFQDHTCLVAYVPCTIHEQLGTRLL